MVLLGEGEETELRDLQLGQVVKLGEAAALIIQLLDGTRSADQLLVAASEALGEEVNPLGLVELLQALDRRALLDTPRARMVANQGLVRADIAALNRLARRERGLEDFVPGDEEEDLEVRVSPGANFSCHSCTRCCSERNVLGPIFRAERDKIIDAFASSGNREGSDPSHFIPLPGAGSPPVYLLRTQGGFCSYLEADGMCRIHQELGEEYKPAVCRAFPFRPVRTPEGWDVGLSLSCPTVASGGGSDPSEEAARTIVQLGKQLPVARRVTENVQLLAGVEVPYARYRAWEEAALEALADSNQKPVEAWLSAIESFQDLAGSPSGAGGSDPENAVAEDEVPDKGVGTAGGNPTESADTILRDLTLWCELLVGLEPTDPVAIRRFRSGAVRVRQRIDAHDGGAPSVLAEHARRLLRAEFPEEGTAWLTQDTLEGSPLSSQNEGALYSRVSGTDPEVQRRFLSQALVEKRPFDCGTIGRGLILMSLFAAILGLDELEGDELHPSVADVAYLAQHNQIVDILDTRASVRASEASTAVHALILGAQSAATAS